MSKTTVITPDIYLVEPIATDSTKTTTTSTKSPTLIILLAWMDSEVKHIAKYSTAYHQLLFPAAAILVIRTRGSSFYRLKSTQQKLMLPAVKIIRDRAALGTERTLVHTFSNGGCFALRNLDSALRSSPPISILSSSPSSSSSTLVSPPLTTGVAAQAFIFDSCPGSVSLAISIRAFTAWIKSPFLKLPASCVVALVFSLGKIYNFITRKRPTLALVSSYLTSHLPQTSPRLYLYSSTDLLIPHKDVEEHAKASSDLGVEVKMIKFEGTQHVAHVRGEGNEKKYWEAVRSIWERSEELSEKKGGEGNEK